jgi:hypothetical protein
MTKQKKKKGQSRIPLIVIGAFLTLGGLAFIAPGLFGSTGYVTEIYRSERVGGSQNINGNPNAYYWQVSYKFKTANGEIETGSVQVVGDAISSKSGIRAGSPVRYIAFKPEWNRPGSVGIDWSGVAYLVFGVPILILGVKKPKPKKTPAQKSREYRAAKEKPCIPVPGKPAGSRELRQAIYQSGGEKMFCENCGTQINADAEFCRACGTSVDARAKQAPAAEPDWDSFEYDDTPLTTEEYNQLDELLTEDEWEEEFELTYEEHAMDAA